MKFTRRFTKKGESVFDNVDWTLRTSKITNADGSLVFEMNDAEIPADWSQLATDIVVSKYFRKAGVPQLDKDGNPILDASGQPKTGPEKSVRQIVHRLAGCWRSPQQSLPTSGLPSAPRQSVLWRAKPAWPPEI